MDSISNGCEDKMGENGTNFVEKIINCRSEISKWSKNNLMFGKEKVSELKRDLEEIQKMIIEHRRS